ncbi:hypothetical protein [Pantoea sp. At-9b]|uniref:hypothetical protein n=1 Tax=Pantoea sp. (strain At-9b) TaxID=592316 RepID=UPI0012379A37|nr:hypothetical protein [Pantoea sp. At-9b]
MKILQMVTLCQRAQVEKCVAELGIDRVIAGHRNRRFGGLSSHSVDDINHLQVDILIKHLKR